MSIRKQYSFPSELSLQRPEPTYKTRPLTRPRPILEPRPTADVSPRPRPTLEPIPKPRPPITDVSSKPKPYTGSGDFRPPVLGGDGEAPYGKAPLDDEATDGDSVKKADWLPIILIGVGVVIFIMKPFK